MSINNNSSSNLNSMYGSGSIASNGNNRMLGDGAVISNSNLGNRIISSHNNSSQQQHFESFPPSGRGYSAVAQLGANRGVNNDHDFAIDNEDFPALPGSSLLNKNLADHVVGSSDSKHAASASSSQIQGANNMFSGSGSSDFNAQGQHGSSHPLLSNIASASAGASQQPVTKEQKFGLAGLLDVIRFTDKVSGRPIQLNLFLFNCQDANTLALGTDLTTFGLNLNSSDSLFPAFSSPFTDQPQVADPQFNTPACYMMHPPSLKSEHLSKFQLETLFYMFYAMPKDILQACAAQELYRREWRYHGEMRLWLKPRAPQELMQSHPNVQFVFFDSAAWETRLFTAAPRNSAALLSGLVSDEDVRVKAPSVNAIPLSS